MKLFVCIALLTPIAAMATGCGGSGGGRSGYDVSPAKPPPGFPAPRDVEIDAPLQAAAHAEVLAALRSSREIVRAHAVESLRFIPGPSSADAIVQALDDTTQTVSFAACLAIGDQRLVAALPKLRTMAIDRDVIIRLGVRFALHRLGDTTGSHDLEVMAQDPDPHVRGATALVLGRLGEPSAVNLLRVMRVDTNAAVRQQADEALLRLGDERGREAVIGYIASAKPDDAMLGLMALGDLKDSRFRNHARPLLTNDYAEVGLVAARALGSMNADDGYGVAMLGIKSLEKRQRFLAAAAFGEIGRTDAQALLSPLLKDADDDVRLAAATSLLQIAKEPKRYTRGGDVVR